MEIRYNYNWKADRSNQTGIYATYPPRVALWCNSNDAELVNQRLWIQILAVLLPTNNLAKLLLLLLL